MTAPVDLLLSLFLGGLLTAAGSFLGMASSAARAGAEGAAPAASGPASSDFLGEYLRACAAESRAPVLWYAYRISLGIGLGALLFAFV